MIIRKLEEQDYKRWLEMRLALWPSWSQADHENEMNRMLKDSDSNMFVCVDDENNPIAFLECAIRKFVNGCKTSPVGFLEGAYVEPPYRKTGIASSLIEKAEEWASTRGCKEMGSDALIENEISHKFHEAIGYEETERVVYFRRSL